MYILTSEKNKHSNQIHENFLGKNIDKIVCYKNDNDNHNGNKIEIRLQNYQINFLLIVFEKS